MEYRREIDGLRAMAVLPVIFFHAGFSWFSGGYVGVDVFFVISGYLITSILINDLEKGTFSIAKFYERRARRILPALFFVMLCCIPYAWMWMTPQQFKDFSQAFVAISFFASNILFWSESGYFAPAAEENPLLHTWSLAVEEQFYIFFPIMLFLLWKFGKNPIFYTVMALSVISLLLSEWGWRNSPSANFYLLPTRAWELGIGSLCAFFLHEKLPKSSSFWSVSGIIMIAASVIIYDNTTPFPSLFTLLPVVGTALVIIFAGKGSFVARVLAQKYFVGIGLISFSAYLWHQPLFAFSRIASPSEPSLALMLTLSIASLCLAFFSWKYIENPFRKSKLLVANSRGKIFGYSLGGSLLFVSAGLYGYMNNGFSERTAPSGRTYVEINMSEALRVNHGLSSECDYEFTISNGCRTSDSPSIMVWGDSYAMHLVQAIESSESLESNGFIQFTKSACSPIKDIALTNQEYTHDWSKSCIEFNRSVINWLKENSSIEYVIMSSPLGILYSSAYSSNGKLYDPSRDIVIEKLNETAELIRELGKKPVFISPPPRTGENLSRCARFNLIFSDANKVDCFFLVDEVSTQHAGVMELLNSYEINIPVVNLSEYICEDGICKTYVDGINIYRDSGHLSHAGSSLLGRKFNLLEEIIIMANQNQ